MRSFILAVGACFLLTVPCVAQTVTDVGQNFSRTGKPGEWEGQGVKLSLMFDSAGQICEAVWPAEQYVDNVIRVGQSRVSADQIKSILNSLAPRELRGNPVEPLWGMGETGGGSGSYMYEYENLTVLGFYAFQVGPTAYWDAKPYTFSATAPAEKSSDTAAEKQEPEDNYFERQVRDELFSPADVVLIRWKNRCGK